MHHFIWYYAPFHLVLHTTIFGIMHQYIYGIMHHIYLIMYHYIWYYAPLYLVLHHFIWYYAPLHLVLTSINLFILLIHQLNFSESLSRTCRGGKVHPLAARSVHGHVLHACALNLNLHTDTHAIPGPAPYHLLRPKEVVLPLHPTHHTCTPTLIIHRWTPLPL